MAVKTLLRITGKHARGTVGTRPAISTPVAQHACSCEDGFLAILAVPSTLKIYLGNKSRIVQQQSGAFSAERGACFIESNAISTLPASLTGTPCLSSSFFKHCRASLILVFVSCEKRKVGPSLY